MLEESLLRAVLRRTGQSRQVDQQGDLVRRILEYLRRQVQIKGHLAVSRSGIVCQLEQFSTERGDCRLGSDGHNDLFAAIVMQRAKRNRKLKVFLEKMIVGKGR